jgi:hypothetical protein
MDMKLGFILYGCCREYLNLRERGTNRMKEINNQEFHNFKSSSSSVRGIIPKTG